MWTLVPRGEAVQILKTIRFILFRDDDSFKGCQSNMRQFIYERSATNGHWRIFSYNGLEALLALELVSLYYERNVLDA